MRHRLTGRIRNLDHFEPVFRRAAIGAHPVVGDVRPAGAGRYLLRLSVASEWVKD